MTWIDDNYPDSTIDDWDMPDVADADAWLELRHGDESTWAIGDDEDKQQAMYRAWDYLRGLDWKDDVFDTELPDRVKWAFYVSSYNELTDPGCLQPSLSASDFVVKKSIGNGALVKEFRQGAPTAKQFLETKSLLKPFLRSGGGSSVEINRG